MNKKAQPGVYQLIRTISVIIVIAVLLTIVAPKIAMRMAQAGEKGECQWSVLLSALTRTPGLGFENIPIECKAKYLNITMAEVQENYALASRTMDFYKEKGPDFAKASNIFNNPRDVNQLAEWSINKIVADEMVDCWDKVWQGELPLFDQWWKLIGWGPRKTPENAEEATKAFLGIVPPTLQTPPTFCIVCSRIKFAEDVKNQLAFKQGKIDSLSTWMRFTQVPRTNENYYIYTLAPWLRKYIQYYPYNIEKPVGIVYVRVNYHKVGRTLDYVTGPVKKFVGLGEHEDIPTDKIDKIAVVQYDKVLRPVEDGGAGCHYVID